MPPSGPGVFVRSHPDSSSERLTEPEHEAPEPLCSPFSCPVWLGVPPAQPRQAPVLWAQDSVSLPRVLSTTSLLKIRKLPIV